MRLYGNLMNRIAESSAQPKPEIGMGATIHFYTDRHAATVVDVSKSGRRIVVREDKAIRTDSNGSSESQSYRYEPNPGGAEHVFTLRKNGRWVESKSAMSSGSGLSLGERDEYYDFGF